MSKQDKILVTGGAGFIGSALVRRLVGEGHTVLTVDNLSYAADLANLDSVMDAPNHRFTRLDLADASAVNKAVSGFSPDLIYHLAAESHVDNSINDPSPFIQSNIIGTYNLLEAFRALPNVTTRRLVHISTDEVYGSLYDEVSLFKEDTPYAPNSPYSASKAAADHLARAWHKTYDLDIVITNCSNNYGSHQHPEKLIPTVIRKAIAGEDIPVYGTGNNIRDWLYVDDHVDGIVCVAKKGKAGEKYNIGANNEWTNITLVRNICKILDNKHPDGAPHDRHITFVSDRAGHDLRYGIDCSKIERELGWTSATPFAEGLELTVDWYLDNRQWWEGKLK